MTITNSLTLIRLWHRESLISLHVRLFNKRANSILLIYFRLNGSFESLEAGNIADALVDFTGGVCESVNLKDAGFYDDEERRLTFFNSMRKAMSDRSLVGASITVNSALFVV